MGHKGVSICQNSPNYTLNIVFFGVKKKIREGEREEGGREEERKKKGGKEEGRQAGKQAGRQE